MLDEIRSLPSYQKLLSDIKDNHPLPGLGLARAARLPILAALYADLHRPVIFITDRSDHALTLLDELAFWSPEMARYLFPEPTPLFYEQAAWGSLTRRDRILALTALAIYHIPGAPRPSLPPLVVVPTRAIMSRTLPRREFLKACRLLKPDLQVQPEALQRSWVDIGYLASETVLEPGQFSRRGGLLDVWPSSEPVPVRLDFFGDVLESLRSFDPATQRTSQPLKQVLITPAREVLAGRASTLDLLIQTGTGSPEVDEFFLPLVHPTPSNLLDYLPQQALVVVDDYDSAAVTAAEIEEQAVKLRLDSIKEGTLPNDFPVPYMTWSEIQDQLIGLHALELGRSTALDEGADLSQAFSPGPRFGGRLKPLMEELLAHCRSHQQVVIVSRQCSRLKELWIEYEGNCELSNIPQFIEGSLSEGWVLRLPIGRHIYLFTDSEIFGWERPQPRQRRMAAAEAPESIYADLRPGDWVVHVDYGIGRFSGLVRRMLDGTERDFLMVEYEGGDQLFVPVHQADRLSRYIGPEGEPPAPTHLGTAEWSTAKQKVREAVVEVARDLLELYAKRQVVQGHPFQVDTPWQHELEASFPYVETEDQLRAINEVKRDMESPRPMDRLLCGDVGYGKTEVALRAAFKAVMDGKQVAILVPTTVLAQQHYDTFRQRLAAFPAEVEMLSRFRTSKEQEAIIKRLSSGGVDIVIGTHRLIQPDVQFKELGLVIVDEEQRFGVTHKEYLKKLRTEVDVLTLTATPIPRTLYMALTGVRDISTINTPPEERLPIITHIGPYSPRLVRQAILRELERGGQVFFVHNRVQTIEAMQRHLKKLVPEARVSIAHGQMNEAELSQVMHLFTRGEIDVLLCTSIIESGLDIPNANTLIVDRGDTFGLAQLYQLRGRVGRGAQRAYAFFFRHRKKPPTPEGLERLDLIAENTQLGSGYSIAMRDLEMRGAGDMLGTRQSGYIASVGFHLYTRLLSEAVRGLRGIQGIPSESDSMREFRAVQMPVNVDLPLSVGIPVDYVLDQNMRLQLYRRIADLENDDDLQAMADEFNDRFGTLPAEVQNLFYQLRVKLRAEQVGLSSVVVEGDQIVLRYPPLPEGVNSRNLPPIGQEIRAGRNAYWMPFDKTNNDWQPRLLEVISSIKVQCQPS